MKKTFCCENMGKVVKDGEKYMVGDIFEETKPRDEDEYIPVVFKKEGPLRTFVKYCPFCGTNLKAQPITKEIKADSTTSNGDEEITITQK